MTVTTVRTMPDTYYINDWNISGAIGRLYGRTRVQRKDGLVQLDRLAVQLTAQCVYYNDLYEIFVKKEVFRFKIHRGLKVRFSATGVITELDKNPDNITCLVECERF